MLVAQKKFTGGLNWCSPIKYPLAFMPGILTGYGVIGLSAVPDYFE